jgi:hypothetical protein
VNWCVTSVGIPSVAQLPVPGLPAHRGRTKSQFVCLRWWDQRGLRVGPSFGLGYCAGAPYECLCGHDVPM